MKRPLTLVPLFVLPAFVFALAMNGAACATTTSFYYPPEGGAEGGFVIGSPDDDGGEGDNAGGRDGAARADASGGDGEDGATCPTTSVSPSALRWKAPRLMAGSCTQADLNELIASVNSGLTVSNATCSNCVFGRDNLSNWAPIVLDGADQIVDVNVGGCIAVRTGSNACGKAYQNFFDCRLVACADCASTAMNQCLTAAANGTVCASYLNDVATVCGDAIDDAEQACEGTSYIFEGAVKALCIGGI